MLLVVVAIALNKINRLAKKILEKEINSPVCGLSALIILTGLRMDFKLFSTLDLDVNIDVPETQFY